MPTPYIGEVRMFGGNFAPAGWAFCEGQTLSVAANTPLFNVIGTTYGGNGTTNFNLPDLRGRVPIQAGQGPGLSNRPLGQAGGAPTHTLTVAEIPPHSHPLRGSATHGISDRPEGRVHAGNPARVPGYAPNGDADMAPEAVGSTGGNAPHNNMQPSLVVSYIIALQGIVPSP